ncbi:MAG: DUF2061 domain-containing protein [Candidatus Omnitrophota bacterium]
MEHPKRSLIKALTWRSFGLVITMGIVFFYSGDLKESFMVSVGVESLKFLLYYTHERIWNRIKFGRHKAPEYQI